MALNAELAKEYPDTEIASALQKEISDLQAQLDQEYVRHIIRMKEINPARGLYYQNQED